MMSTFTAMFYGFARRKGARSYVTYTRVATRVANNEPFAGLFVRRSKTTESSGRRRTTIYRLQFESSASLMELPLPLNTVPKLLGNCY